MAMGCLAAACGAAAAAATAGHASRTPRRASSAQGLDVLPFPGTPDAAPATNIDLPAASRAQVQSVTAVGSRSGLHAGHLSAQPPGHGTAFSPNRPFSPGEHVSVTATFRSATAGTASGAPGAKQISFSFSVAQAGSVAGSEGRGAKAEPPAARRSKPLTHSFVTQPGFLAPVVPMHGQDPDPASAA